MIVEQFKALGDPVRWTIVRELRSGQRCACDLAKRANVTPLVIDDPATGPKVLTFGGDRETFDFTDPENYLRVDNDVWTFAPPA